LSIADRRSSEQLIVLYSIVAIHGLNGHAIHTWEYDDNIGRRFMWLRDSLPEQFPDARIMTYGYNANVLRGISPGRVRTFAEMFLKHLMKFREGITVSVQVPPSSEELIAYL